MGSNEGNIIDKILGDISKKSATKQILIGAGSGWWVKINIWAKNYRFSRLLLVLLLWTFKPCKNHFVSVFEFTFSWSTHDFSGPPVFSPWRLEKLSLSSLEDQSSYCKSQQTKATFKSIGIKLRKRRTKLQTKRRKQSQARDHLGLRRWEFQLLNDR